MKTEVVCVAAWDWPLVKTGSDCGVVGITAYFCRGCLMGFSLTGRAKGINFQKVRFCWVEAGGR